DRTKSPAIVSAKREYQRFWPETFGNSGPEFDELGTRRRNRTRENPLLAALFFVPREVTTIGVLAGWRRSAVRARLCANSLQTGNFTGNFLKFWPLWRETQARKGLLAAVSVSIPYSK